VTCGPACLEPTDRADQPNPRSAAPRERRQRRAIVEIARQYGAQDLRVFGSAASGEATEDSNLDLLVRFEPGQSLLDQGGLPMDLENQLGVKVDVLSEGGVRERSRRQVVKEAVAL
jgi:uncharacterized protein